MDQHNKVLQEKEEAELLIEKGMFFQAGKYKFTIKPLTLGTILIANKYAVDMKINLTEDNETSVFDEYNRNTIPLLNFIAVCVLSRKWKIFLFRKLLVRCLKWNLKPKDVIGITLSILKMYDMGNFITSIRLISEQTMTSPKKK